jgi:Lar family restriction alleviation protein
MSHPNDEYTKIEGFDDQLLPCPFCGSSAELWQRKEGAGNFSKAVTCGDNECEMYMSTNEFHKATKKQAIAAWNRRAPLTTPPQAKPK